MIQSRKRGAAKAAATRRRKKKQAQQRAQTVESDPDPSTQMPSMQQPTTDQGTSTEREESEECFCNACGEDYYSSNSPFWISCDLCLLWYCSSCEKLLQEPYSETYKML